jgi:hypothetical protein
LCYRQEKEVYEFKKASPRGNNPQRRKKSRKKQLHPIFLKFMLMSMTMYPSFFIHPFSLMPEISLINRFQAIRAIISIFFYNSF